MQRRLAIALSLMLVTLAPAVVAATWPAPGIASDSIGLRKTRIVECCFRGYVRTIQVGMFTAGGALEIAVLPQTGLLLLDAATFKERATLSFTKPDGEPIWFGISPQLVRHNNKLLIAMRGGGFGKVGLLDHSGHELWTFAPRPSLAPNGMVVDEGPDRDPRFFVSDRGMLYRLNSSGQVVWSATEDADHIVLVPAQDGGDAGFATASSASRTIVLWSAAGERTGKVQLPFAPDGFSFVQSGPISGFVVKSGRRIAFVERSGAHRFTYDYGTLPVLHGPVAVLARLEAGALPVIALRLTSSSATGKSVFTVLSLDGRRLFEEFLGGGPALAVVPVHGESRERLLIGEGTRDLWSYEKPTATDESTK